MKYALSLCLAALLPLAASADTVFSSSPTSITDILDATLDGESIGTHIVVNGQMTYNPQLAVGGIVNESALSSFNLTIMDTYEYGWGVPNVPVTTYYADLSSLESFSYNMVSDALQMTVLFNPEDPHGGTLSVFKNPGGAIPEDVGQIIGFVGTDTYGNFDPTQVGPIAAGVSAPEPVMLPLVGLALIGLGLYKKRLRPHNM